MNLQCSFITAGCPYTVGGFTFAGVPGVIIGHNDQIAWAFTNNGADVTGPAYEALAGDRYVRDGHPRPLHIRTETIHVAGGDPVHLTIRSTKWGPLYPTSATCRSRCIDEAFDVTTLPGEANEVAVALRWTALTPGPTADAILRSQPGDRLRPVPHGGDAV